MKPEHSNKRQKHERTSGNTGRRNRDRRLSRRKQHLKNVKKQEKEKQQETERNENIQARVSQASERKVKRSGSCLFKEADDIGRRGGWSCLHRRSSKQAALAGFQKRLSDPPPFPHSDGVNVKSEKGQSVCINTAATRNLHGRS